jgi:hypothetical protein
MTPETFLLLPPILFVVVLALVAAEYKGFDALSLKQPEGKPQPEGKTKPYACGEDVADHRAQPDYGQFFHFAFFFTIMHVVALVVTTHRPPACRRPRPSPRPSWSAPRVGLFILFRVDPACRAQLRRS